MIKSTTLATTDSFLCSTSNHNSFLRSSFATVIVLYLCSTSNHNYSPQIKYLKLLFYTFVLHQTTTNPYFLSGTFSLFYTFVLHQTTTTRPSQIVCDYCSIPLFYIKPQLGMVAQSPFCNCSIPLFYIKPQLFEQLPQFHFIVLYLCSTSNHNC